MALTLLDLADAKTAVRKQKAESAAKNVSEAVAPFLFGLTGGDVQDPTFKRITSPNTRRDLNPLMHLRMQEVAFYLKATTPFGKRIVEVITDYVVGEGFTPAATDPAVQEVVNRFWDDPINNITQNLKDYCDELTTFGELCLPVIVNPVDGFVRVGYVDPQRIDAVEYGMLSTGDGDSEIQISYPVAVRLRRDVGEAQGKVLQIVRLDEDVNSPTFGQLVGDCFYAAINKAKGASRGLSELFSLADWIDVFDQMMFDFADRVRFLNAYVWHYALDGADEKQITDFTKKVTQDPPRQGGVQVTNSKVKIEALTPDLKGADTAETIRSVKLYGLGGAGLPAWFFADPMDSNRNTASEMNGPTGKKLTNRQNHLRALVLQLMAFTVQQAIYHGVLPQGIDPTVTLQVPDLMIKDLAAAASTLGAVVNAVSIMEENGWIRAETAARASHVVLSQIGIEVDSKEEFLAAQKEKDERQTQLMPDQSSLASALAQLNQGQNPDGQQPAQAKEKAAVQ